MQFVFVFQRLTKRLSRLGTELFYKSTLVLFHNKWTALSGGREEAIKTLEEQKGKGERVLEIVYSLQKSQTCTNNESYERKTDLAK